MPWDEPWRVIQCNVYNVRMYACGSTTVKETTMKHVWDN